MALASLPGVHRLLLAKLTCPSFHPTPGEEVEVFGYLVDHPDGAVLLDTGVGSDSEFLNRSYQPRHVPLDEALAVHGRRLSDVVAVVNSHLHFEHRGRALVAAQAVYTAGEWRAGADVEQACEGFREVYAASFDGLRQLAPDEVYLSHDARTAGG